MIREFEPSEFIATILVARSEALQHSRSGKLSFNRLYAILHRVTRMDPCIRIRMNTTSITSFCSYMNIECVGQKIKVRKMSRNDIEKLSQYKPTDEKIIHAFVSANF